MSFNWYQQCSFPNAFILITAVYVSDRISTDYNGVLFRVNTRISPVSFSESMSTFYLTVNYGFFLQIHVDLFERTSILRNTVNGQAMIPSFSEHFRMNTSISGMLSTDMYVTTFLSCAE